MKEFIYFLSEENDKRSKLKTILINRFTLDDKITTKEMESLAKENGYDKNELDQIVRDLLSSLFHVRRYKMPKTIDEKQLEKGIKHEYEHTSDIEIAKKIALDHISEIPNYYDLLEKLEKDYE